MRFTLSSFDLSDNVNLMRQPCSAVMASPIRTFEEARMSPAEAGPVSLPFLSYPSPKLTRT
eukprot:scaffold143_cov260-Pinguiococcus_pyrenoidosus.AAC.31